MSWGVDAPYEGLQACTAALDCQAKQSLCLAWVMHSPSAAWPSHPPSTCRSYGRAYWRGRADQELP